MEHACRDPKDGELCLSGAKPEETLVEARSDTDVQIVRLQGAISLSYTNNGRKVPKKKSSPSPDKKKPMAKTEQKVKVAVSPNAKSKDMKRNQEISFSIMVVFFFWSWYLPMKKRHPIYSPT